MDSGYSTGQIVKVFCEETWDEIKTSPMNLRPWVSAGLYFISLLFFGVSGWKAAVFAIVVLIAVKFGYASRPVVASAVAFFFLTMTVWCELIPDPRTINLRSSSIDSWSAKR